MRAPPGGLQSNLVSAHKVSGNVTEDVVPVPSFLEVDQIGVPKALLPAMESNILTGESVSVKCAFG